MRVFSIFIKSKMIISFRYGVQEKIMEVREETVQNPKASVLAQRVLSTTNCNHDLLTRPRNIKL